MRSPWSTRFGGRWTLAAATAIMALLLVGLAVLQYYWVGQASQATRERLRRELETAADRIADDFDREVFRAFVSFQPPRDRGQELAARLAEGWDHWRASARLPELVSGVYAIEVDRVDPDAAPLRRLDPASRELRPSDWPPELAMLDQRLDPATFARRPGAGHHRLPRAPVFAAAPALLLSAPPAEMVVVLLDRRFIADVFLPELAELHLGPEPRETAAWVIDHSRRRSQPVFATGPLPRRLTPTDLGVARRPLLGLRPFPELRAQGFQRFFDDPDARRELEGARRGGSSRAFAGGPFEPAPWALVVGRAEGSLDAAVARLRRRNLAIGLAVVALLGATAALLLLSARQAQRLARREMELVAGITHELRTPLAAIGSAADNLADGVVLEPEQIRRYGSLIRGETHRLGGLVAQVLEFAGAAAARRRAPSPQPVEVGAVVDRVLEDLGFLIEEKGFVVERADQDALPPALAEPEALRRAVDNVIGNAIKYGERGRWVRIECTLAPGAERRITIRVSDRGPGIPRAERRRIFEPFYRGDAAARHLHGTGLGLAVTRSMLEGFGATIEVEESEPGAGTTFLITVPAAPETT